MPEENAELKRRMRAMWTAGDFGKIAEQNTEHAEEFVARLGIQPGMRLLDVACGTGNCSIPAAQAKAQVTGLDIAPNLLEQARARAADAGVQIRFDEGDAEELPYETGAFDLVISMYGAMFAPHPEKVAAELARVCKPGGTIAMANWTPASYPAKIFALGTRYLPPPPGLQPPVLWGDEQVARERLGRYSSDLQMTLREVWLSAPVPPKNAAARFAQNFGPVKITLERLDPQHSAAYRADLEKLWTQYNEATDDTTALRGEYLEIRATRI